MLSGAIFFLTYKYHVYRLFDVQSTGDETDDDGRRRARGLQKGCDDDSDQYRGQWVGLCTNCCLQVSRYRSKVERQSQCVTYILSQQTSRRAPAQDGKGRTQ